MFAAKNSFARSDRKRFASVGSGIALFLALLTFLPTSLRAQLNALDSSWVLSVGAQSVQVNDDGSFLIPNISAPDEFGPGGPGTRPDFLSDDWVRLTGYSNLGGITRYCWTEPFKLTQNESILITYEDLTISLNPPPVPKSLLAVPANPTLTAINQTTQVTITAFLRDGTTKNVSSAAAYTTFRTSNVTLATVSDNGLVTAKKEGKVFITAINEGATAVTQINIAPGANLTKIVGVVTLADGTPVSGAEVVLAGLNLKATTNASGGFTINNVPISESLVIDAITVQFISESGTFFGSTTSPALVPGGTTDVGIIGLMDLCEEIGEALCVDSDNDCIPDAIEIALDLDPDNPDTDGNTIPDGEEDIDLDGLTNCAEIFLGTDPEKADSDNDGLDDGEEVFAFGTNPRNPDTDFDGLRDGDEIFPQNGRPQTDPFKADSDLDGADDGLEIAAGTDPLDPNSLPPLRIYSSEVSFLNALFGGPPANVRKRVASPAVSLLNIVEQAVESGSYSWLIASHPVSYRNEIDPPEPPSEDPTTLVASMPVSYLNTGDFDDPSLSPVARSHVASLKVSFNNFTRDGESPPPARFSVHSKIVSYLNQP